MTEDRPQRPPAPSAAPDGGVALAERLEALAKKAMPLMTLPLRSMREGNQYFDNLLHDGMWTTGRIVGASRVDGLHRPWNPVWVKPAELCEEVVRLEDEVADLVESLVNNLPTILAALRSSAPDGWMVGAEAMREAAAEVADIAGDSAEISERKTVYSERYGDTRAKDCAREIADAIRALPTPRAEGGGS